MSVVKDLSSNKTEDRDRVVLIQEISEVMSAVTTSWPLPQPIIHLSIAAQFCVKLSDSSRALWPGDELKMEQFQHLLTSMDGHQETLQLLYLHTTC